jgi:hypothetical protein
MSQLSLEQVEIRYMFSKGKLPVYSAPVVVEKRLCYAPLQALNP